MTMIAVFLIMAQTISLSRSKECRIEWKNGDYSIEQGYFKKGSNLKPQNIFSKDTRGWHNITKRIKRKGLIWVRDGKSKRFFVNGDLKSEGKYANNKRTGPWVFYYRGLVERAVGKFRFGRKVGIWRVYHLSGGLANKGLYIRGKKHKVHRSWAENGQIIRLETFYHGSQHGQSVEWYSRANPDRNPLIYPPYYCPVGRLLWDFGKKWNDALALQQNKSLSREGEAHCAISGGYYFGQRNGHFKAWYVNGTPRFSITYIRGKPDGQVRIWYPNGTLYSIQYYNRGVKEGLCRFWYADGTLREESRFRKGLRHGEYSSFYPNGLRKCKGLYRVSKRIGKWFHYKRDGKTYDGRQYPF